MLTLSHGHILAVYFNATDSEILAGSRWYDDARAAAEFMADRHCVSLSTAAGVIAALSPNNKWQRNLRDADALVQAYVLGGHSDAAQIKVSTYHANKAKALAILSGSYPLDVLGGLKVRSFYQCILGDRSACCIDGHAYSVWRGQYVPTTATPKISSKLYQSICADYQRAADMISSVMGTNYSASKIQAITWCVWQRIRREVGA